jgi:hypothetical protein
MGNTGLQCCTDDGALSHPPPASGGALAANAHSEATAAARSAHDGGGGGGAAAGRGSGGGRQQPRRHHGGPRQQQQQQQRPTPTPPALHGADGGGGGGGRPYLEGPVHPWTAGRAGSSSPSPMVLEPDHHTLEAWAGLGGGDASAGADGTAPGGASVGSNGGRPQLPAQPAGAHGLGARGRAFQRQPPINTPPSTSALGHRRRDELALSGSLEESGGEPAPPERLVAGRTRPTRLPG